MSKKIEGEKAKIQKLIGYNEDDDYSNDDDDDDDDERANDNDDDDDDDDDDDGYDEDNPVQRGGKVVTRGQKAAASAGASLPSSPTVPNLPSSPTTTTVAAATLPTLPPLPPSPTPIAGTTRETEEEIERGKEEGKMIEPEGEPEGATEGVTEGMEGEMEGREEEVESGKDGGEGERTEDERGANPEGMGNEDETPGEEGFFVIQPSKTKIFGRQCGVNYSLIPTRRLASSVDYDEQLARLSAAIEVLVGEKMRTNRQFSRGIKLHVSISVLYDVLRDEELIDTPTFHFSLKSTTILSEGEIEEALSTITQSLRECILDRKARGSGFLFRLIQTATVSMCQFVPLKGGRYLPLPPALSCRRGLLNIKTRDDKCILDAIAAHKHPATVNKSRASHYSKYRSEINSEGVVFPITLAGLNRLEFLNPDLSLNVYSYGYLPRLLRKTPDRKKGYSTLTFYPWRISKRRSGSNLTEVNLLMFTEAGDEAHPNNELDTPREEHVRHMALITDLSSLTRAARTSYKGKSLVCRYCLVHFYSSRRLADHDRLCKEANPVAVRMPDPGAKMKFESPDKSYQLPFWIVADFECSLIRRKTAENKVETPLPPNSARKFPWIVFPSEVKHVARCRKCAVTRPCEDISQSTVKLCHLQMFSWGYLIVSADRKRDFPFRYQQSPDCNEGFLVSLKRDMIKLYSLLRKNYPLTISPRQRKEFNEAQKCALCGEAFKSSRDKHRDHQHDKPPPSRKRKWRPLFEKNPIRRRPWPGRSSDDGETSSLDSDGICRPGWCIFHPHLTFSDGGCSCRSTPDSDAKGCEREKRKKKFTKRRKKVRKKKDGEGLTGTNAGGGEGIPGTSGRGREEESSSEESDGEESDTNYRAPLCFKCNCRWVRRMRKGKGR